jgi:hypothetical protein
MEWLGGRRDSGLWLRVEGDARVVCLFEMFI